MQKKRDNGTILFAYSGASMWPLFQEGDLLVVKKVCPDLLRVGDCIVFRSSNNESRFIVHRISAVKPRLKTRGDQRGVDDSEFLDPSCILGRVTGRIRAGRASKVHGGLAGCWTARAVRLAGLIDPTRNAKGGRIARAIQRLLAPFSASFLRGAKVVSFASLDGQARNYLIGRGRVMGVYDQETGHWRLSWPYSVCLKSADLTFPKPDRS